MLIDEKDPVCVKVLYRKLGKGYVAFSEKAFKEAKLDEKTKEHYKTVNVMMKPLTWGMYNELQDRAYSAEDASGKRKFNYRTYKESKLKTLIISWDAQTTNDKGELITIPVNEKNILNLSPDIAEAIIDGYDQQSVITDEEEGN